MIRTRAKIMKSRKAEVEKLILETKRRDEKKGDNNDEDGSNKNTNNSIRIRIAIIMIRTRA